MNYLLFADDTTVFKTDLNELRAIIEREMTELKKWFDYNKLCLNWDKTKYMVFGNKGKCECTNLVIQDVNIECVSEINFWGLS